MKQIFAAKPSGEAEVETGSGPITFRYNLAAPACRTVIFTFHGAIDRATRELPAFFPIMPQIANAAHQVSIADPSMMIPADLPMAWYTGHDGFATQDLLRGFIAGAIAALGAQRVIFFGSSGGGFAALYNSWHFPGSICVTGNPQTAIARYYPRHIENYLSACWPGRETLADIPDSVCTDVGALYEQGFPNTVIYLQSAGDYFHFRNHLIPFLSRAAIPVKDSPFVLENGFWGKLSHSGSITQEAFMPWLRAAIAAPTVRAEDIMLTRDGLRQRLAAPTRPAATAAAKESRAADPQTDALSRSVNDWLLRN